MRGLRFYFDFSCPYAYVASTRVEAFAQRVGLELEARPMLLGGVFRAVQTPQNLSETLGPSKARHNLADMHRQAALAGVPLTMPAGHPIRTVQALRALLVVGPPYLPLAHRFFRAYWVEGIDLSTEDGVRRVLTEAGHDADEILAQTHAAAIKAELRARTDQAIAAGVFGVPAFELTDADGEVCGDLYWGVDRLDMIAAHVGKPPDELDPLGDGAAPVDLYFDYSSPFAYLGCRLGERLFGDRARWRPMLLGAVFKQVGTANVPMFAQNSAKRRHTSTDLHRQAELLGARFQFPSRFPMNTVLALRVTLAAGGLERAEGRRLVHALFEAYWADDRDLADAEVVASVCDAVGLDGAALVRAATEQPIKDALRTATSEAVEAGVFGAPTTIVHTADGPQLYWGADRIRLAHAAARSS